MNFKPFVYTISVDGLIGLGLVADCMYGVCIYASACMQKPPELEVGRSLRVAAYFQTPFLQTANFTVEVLDSFCDFSIW